MSKQTINIGASPNDGTGTPLRTSFDYTNQNFTEIYTALGGGVALPGATTQVIFNDGGTNLAGDAGLVYNKTTDALTIAGLVTAGSAAITGDLTVDTNVLKVDTTNNAVGINVTPNAALSLTINGEIGMLANNLFYWNGYYSGGFKARAAGYSGNVYVSGAGDFLISNTSTSAASAGSAVTFRERYRIDKDGIHTWEYVGGVAGTAMTLNSTGLGVGVTPSAWATGLTGLQIGSLGGASILGYSNAAEIGSNFYFDTVGYKYGATAASSLLQFTSGEFRFKTAASGTVGTAITFTQAMTLDASGNLMVGQAAVTGANIDSFVYNKSGSYVSVSHVNGTGSGTAYLQFLYNNTSVGTITQNGTTGVLYNITSDYRLKESVKPILGGLARVNALKPSVYNWKSDGSAGEGFIAHELAEVVPFAVSGEKDAVNADGTIKSQGIDMSRVVPILVAAIQELTARVQILEAR